MKKIIKSLAPHFLISFYHWFLAYLGAFVYGFPSKKMVVIGVMGTRGKTSTANFIWSILNAAGEKAGLTGTANIRVGAEEQLNIYHMTMPGRFFLQRFLKKMADAGCKYAIIETPSEGVEQFRHKGIFYDVAVLTTLYPEYLAVHNWDFERCKKMHLKVFEELNGQPRKIVDGKKIPKIIVVDSDNDDKDLFLKPPADKKITYGLKAGSDLTATSVKAENGIISFEVNGEKYELGTKGSFNVSNALGAIAVGSALGIDKEYIKKGLKDLSLVPGRMEKIDEGQNFDVFVDYAHDGPSMAAALKAVEEIKKPGAKTTVILGAEGGGRDKKKRPVMGKLAGEKSDYVVVTDTDPYDDDPMEIINDIAAAAEAAGKSRNKNLFAIPERREGIRKALNLAEAGDIVLITGKGAEQSMIIGGKTSKWDDRDVVRQELKKILK
ncbi:MAG TPA: UDP-N-acetylmuramyl-tripeptide synthetase [Candidatus Paceibacterota bacterium]|nr:UDP-N-acetylmuramyl-tripeptide synthetase [Candidatus Paceibacterota bacterium]